MFQVPERKIKLADSVLSQSQILEIFVSLDEEKKEMNYSPVGTDYPPMKSTGTSGTDLRINDDKIITKIKVIPIKKSEQNLWIKRYNGEFRFTFKWKLKINIQQIRFLSSTINKQYLETMLNKLTHIYKNE